MTRHQRPWNDAARGIGAAWLAAMLSACIANPTPYPAEAGANGGTVGDAAERDAPQPVKHEDAGPTGPDEQPPPGWDEGTAGSADVMDGALPEVGGLPDADGTEHPPDGGDAWLEVADQGEADDGALDVADPGDVADANPEVAEAIEVADAEPDVADPGQVADGGPDGADDALPDGDGGGAVGGCFVEQPCAESYMLCWQPDETLPCGMCYTPQPDEVCATDDQCGAGLVCQGGIGLCTCGGEMLCVPACSAATCGEGEVCAADGHCAAAPCTLDDDCPSDFACSAGGCQRLSCSASADCTGYCVKGQCYAEPGYCSPVPP